MHDPTQLATVVVAALSPYFVEAAKKAAGKVGEESYEGGKRLVSWLREKLSSDETKALDRVAADPTNGDKQAALRVSLSETLAANPGLQNELAILLHSLPRFAASQNMSQDGDGNVAVQTIGSENTTAVSRN